MKRKGQVWCAQCLTLLRFSTPNHPTQEVTHTTPLIATDAPLLRLLSGRLEALHLQVRTYTLALLGLVVVAHARTADHSWRERQRS